MISFGYEIFLAWELGLSNFIYGIYAYNSTLSRILSQSISTLPIAEILSSKNVRAFLVCGILMKSFKKKNPENMKKNRGGRLEVTC